MAASLKHGKTSRQGRAQGSRPLRRRCPTDAPVGRQALWHPGDRRRRHRRGHRRRAARHGGPYRRQGRVGSRHDRPQRRRAARSSPTCGSRKRRKTSTPCASANGEARMRSSACDNVVAARSGDALSKVRPGRNGGRPSICTKRSPATSQARSRDYVFPGAKVCRTRSRTHRRQGADAFRRGDRTGDRACSAIRSPTNLFMLGYAYQNWAPCRCPRDAILERAIELNGVAVPMNQQAFNWGRRAAHDIAEGPPLAFPEAKGAAAHAGQGPADALRRRYRRDVDYLTQYQKRPLRRRYTALVDKVRTVQATQTPRRHRLDRSGRALLPFKLMAYKDEYEVARLHSRPGVPWRSSPRHSRATTRSDSIWRRRCFAKRDPVTGELRKREYGGWMLPRLRTSRQS